MKVTVKPNHRFTLATCSVPLRTRIGVATSNPLKVEAVEGAFRAFFGEVKVCSFEPSSSLPQQPVDAQIVDGAVSRAKEGVELGYDYGVGIEGGLLHLGGGTYLTGFSAIISKTGEMHGAWGLA